MNSLIKYIGVLLVLILTNCSSSGSLTNNEEGEANLVDWTKHKILVYTKNGEGFVHDNIPSAVASIEKLGRKYGFKVDVSENPEVMTEENLKQYTLLLFPSTNNDVFDTDAQRLAFRRYIEAGGGFVGLHSVTGTERNWNWFKMMIGGTFDWHVPFMPFKVKVLKPDHPTVEGIPEVWERNDECYFTKQMYPGITVTMAHDLNDFDQEQQEEIKNHSGSFANYFPAVWYQHFEGGTIWITTLGHAKEDYEDPMHMQHIFQGVKFVASHSGEPDFSKSYASDRDTPLR